MSALIIIAIPLISLILAILPFWYVRKKYQPNIKWRHLGTAFLVAVILLVGFTLLYFWIDNLIYKYSTLKDPFIQSTLLNWLTLSLLIIISPFPLYHLKYQDRTKKGYLITAFLNILVILFIIALWIFILILGIAQFQRLG